MEIQILWQNIVSSLGKKISSPLLSSWLYSVKIEAFEKDSLTLAVPNIFVKEWLEKKINKDLIQIAQTLLPSLKEIKYTISKEKMQRVSKKEESLDQQFLDLAWQRSAGLNPKYTFENFVVGEFNQLAHACAQAVVKSWQKGLLPPYNPLFIYSKVGLGKTHLLEAIGNELIKTKKLKVRYIPCPTFTNKIIASIREGKTNELIEEFQEFSILIIDDIEFISGKERTQDIFFQIFNNAIEKDKQIILSSDRPPKAIKGIEERIRSRFEGGMIADISAPSYEERIAILELKLKERGKTLPSEIIEFLGKEIKTNIRELEGGLIKALIIFENEKSSQKTIKKLAEIIKTSERKVSPDKILEMVGEFYGFSKDDLLCQRREKNLVLARQVAMYLLRKKLSLSLPEIGVRLGNKDHTTVKYACEKIEENIKKDVNFKKEIEAIEERIESFY